ncbi:pyridoxamine 5'-phosphate oxidase family protein [Paracoccus sp. SCSIO 75233]|uniref:pyridoxamine 5'-phosphate oxidase family protein n=1 Tax=Paracoccus sp. SCSIO 75233 TaxID=3017782 RepID=UPI0022F06C19|nr:pyridoxamine 5'-phosphate oxidase family protein [Paracoccus sp. SCSIO 75233]WBU52610.1 pyridoxamine 5'-phosphate oxidase family protein [Paracoccus sp. SCSIO 75233]
MQPAYARARQQKRAVYDEETIHAILDSNMVGHVGFIADDRPMVIPMAYARIGQVIYLHGASKTRITRLSDVPLCMEVTRLTGIVAARSGFHHSVNYESAVIHGQARKVTGDELGQSLDAILDHLLPGRSAEVRPMNAQERKATGVIALEIEHASAKIRTGPPVDDEEDHALPIWAGVIPVTTALGEAVRDGYCGEDIATAPSITAARRRFA